MIAVKGMEMPREVWDCPMYNFGICLVTSAPPYECCIGAGPDGERPAWCPLVEVDGIEVKEV